MARTKSTPRRAPSFAPTVNTAILHRAATNPNQPYEPLQPARLEEIPLRLNWTSAVIAQAQAAKETRNLRKALDIITAALKDRSAVSDHDLDWAKSIGLRVQAEDQAAERALRSANSEEIMTGATDLPAVQNETVRAPLTKENLQKFLGEERESDQLSEVDDVSELDPLKEQKRLIAGVVVFCMALYSHHKGGAGTG